MTWRHEKGRRPLLLETVVHPDHDGTCYKAVGWEHVGETAGRRASAYHGSLPLLQKPEGDHADSP